METEHFIIVTCSSADVTVIITK